MDHLEPTTSVNPALKVQRMDFAGDPNKFDHPLRMLLSGPTEG
jgi:hypothetical protein